MEKTKKDQSFQKNLLPFIIIGAVFILTVIVTVYFIFFKNKKIDNNYKAVFLDNNEVYFGKLEKKSNNFIKLTDVYYLQVNQISQKNEKGEIVQTPDFQIIKMGTEIHGPKNEMEIVNNHVLFIQELQKDSKVLKVIEKYNTTGQIQEAPQQPVVNNEQPETTKKNK